MPNTALLVMDVQNTIVGRVQDDGYLPRVTRAVDAAREAGIPVIYVVVALRPGHPEVDERNVTFGGLPADAFTEGDPGTAVHPAVAPLPGETVVAKKRISAFAGSDLDLVLRSGGIGHLVLAGIATSGVVLSTVRQAADLDYRLTVLADACYDPDAEVHRVLTEKVFPRQAAVTTADRWHQDG
ncbi:cysteine hydrolase [Actinomadura darangshiensis]|uniref:Cysteine hydrolase n=1 Tax=Actinomadura darangshiensis TaxID=705336 RepID=A0A4R5B7A2_9ACTN|nr:isochorismatase family cysteine hydrolase [Actinomadura darangshiensis]TDD80953.1 cysteine hydrolase [Actinomadura darangshiensis]